MSASPPPGAAGGTVSSDPTASAASANQQNEAAAIQGETGATTTVSAAATGATGDAFPTSINSALVNPGYSFGIGNAPWWSAVSSFLDALQKAYAATVPRAPGRPGPSALTSGLPLTGVVGRAAGGVPGLVAGAVEDLTKPYFGIPALQGLPGGHPQAKLAAKGGAKGATPASAPTDPIAALRAAGAQIGVVIPQNVTTAAQLSAIRLPAALRQELTQAGFNSGAMATLGTLATQPIPTSQAQVPVTAQDLYGQFTKDWGNGTGAFATQWTQDLQNAGLLDLSLGNKAEAVGYAYQALLGKAAAAGADVTPAQELATLTAAPANQSNVQASGLAVDAQQAAQSAFYENGINPSTFTIQNIVQQATAAGLGSPYEIENQARSLATQQALQWAKTIFPGVADQLTADNTVQNLIQPYLSTAGNMLGISPSTIDLTDPKWQKALTGGANGGQMTQDEWAKTLASDPQYGYQNSQAGINAAASVAMSMRNLFGLEGPSAASSWSYSPSYQAGG